MNNVRKQNGITLIALVITIIVLIILAGIAISMTLGENGIFTKAKEAKRLQITAEAKEKIGTDILDAQVEAVQKNETLQQSKVEEIIAKYGELQADGDTIILKDNGYTVSLKEIYNGTTSNSGASTGGSTGNAELDSLKAELAQTTATEDKILKDYKAYSNGKLMTGTMENYAGQTVTVSTITENGENAEITIPQAGYYGTDSKVSVPIEKVKSDIGSINANISNNTLLFIGDGGSTTAYSVTNTYNLPSSIGTCTSAGSRLKQIYTINLTKDYDYYMFKFNNIYHLIPIDKATTIWYQNGDASSPKYGVEITTTAKSITFKNVSGASDSVTTFVNCIYACTGNLLNNIN